MIITWLVLNRFAKLWAVPAALVVAIAVVVIDRPIDLGDDLLAQPVLIAPEFTAGALISIALPLFVVTMASQNIPGMARAWRASATARDCARCSSAPVSAASSRPRSADTPSTSPRSPRR